MMSPETAPAGLLVCEALPEPASVGPVFPGKGVRRPPRGRGGLLPPPTRREIELQAREENRRWEALRARLPAAGPPRGESRRERQAREFDRFLAGVRAVRRASLPILVEVTRAYDSGEIYNSACVDMADYAEPRGLSTREAYAFLRAGHLFRRVPGARVRYLRGLLSLDNAALLGELVEEEGGLPDDRDWVAAACGASSARLREEVEARREERLQGAPVKRVEVRVTVATARGFARVRTLASRRARRPLSRGETFAHLVEDYLDRHDPLRRDRAGGSGAGGGRKSRSRRPKRVASCSLVGPYIPVSERDRCRRRFGDRCALAGCDHRIFLDFAHIRPRALGGANYAWNLLYLCRRHHRMFDAKRILLVGPAGGEQHFEDRRGHRLADLRPPPSPFPARAGP